MNSTMPDSPSLGLQRTLLTGNFIHYERAWELSGVGSHIFFILKAGSLTRCLRSVFEQPLQDLCGALHLAVLGAEHNHCACKDGDHPLEILQLLLRGPQFR